DSNLVALGSALFQDATNSTSAFQVQNAAGAIIMATDTTANQLSVSGNINLNYQGAPNSAPSGSAASGAGLAVSTYYYAVTFVTASGETDISPVSTGVTTTSGNQQVSLTGIATGPSNLVTARKIYRTKAGGNSSS